MEENAGQNLPVNPAMVPALTDWANEPKVTDLDADLQASKPAHDTFIAKVRRWNDLARATGTARIKKVAGRSQVQPKLIRRQAEWRYSALTEPFNSSQKLFDVKPVTFEDAPSARQNELVLNNQFRTKINRVTFIDNYVRASVDEGSAIVRVGWSRVVVKQKQMMPIWSYMQPQSEDDIQRLQAAIQAKQEDPRGFNEHADPASQAAVAYFEETGVPTLAVQTGEQEVEVDKIIDNRPLVEVTNPENVFFDPTCGYDFDKATFVVVSFETSLAELKKEGDRYKNLEHVHWESAATPVHPDHAPQSTDANFNFRDKARRKAVAYEYWGLYDIHNTGELVPIVATWIGNTMIRMEENPFPDGKPPFIIANYMPIKRELLGESDAELLEDNQKILGAVARGMIDLLGRSANSQQGFAKGMLDVLNKRRYESGQDYEFNPNMPPQSSIVEHKYPEIPQSAMSLLQLQNMEAEALTGVKAFSGGLSGDSYGPVATGIRGVLDAAAKREMAILRRLAAGLIKVGKKIIAMNAVFLSEQEVVRVTNEEFITINREELASVAGDFDLDVDISTAEIDNAKSGDLAFMLQTMGNSVDFGITKLILVEIARLKRMPELAKQIERFQPQPDPKQEKLMELQIQREMKEIEKLQSEIELNQAKAMKEQTVAEQGALNTVEQETGTKHARDMEHQTAQSNGNQNLEVTKALLKSKKPEESKPDVEAAVGFNELTKRQRETPAAAPINGIMQRDVLSQTDPRYSLGSKDFDPALDPALNPAINL